MSTTKNVETIQALWMSFPRYRKLDFGQFCTLKSASTWQRLLASNKLGHVNGRIYIHIHRDPKKPALTSWLSIVKYSVRVMSRYCTIMYVQLIWYSKSLSVLNECRACLPDWVQACQRYQCCALSRSSWSAARPTFRSFCRPSRIDLSNQSFQWSQRPLFLREFGNKPFCCIVFILPKKFNNNFIIVRECHYQLRM